MTRFKTIIISVLSMSVVWQSFYYMFVSTLYTIGLTL